MDERLFEQLHQEGLIGDQSMRRIKAASAGRLFSLHGELNIMLYAGVLMITAGLGVLVYENIDSIGHLAILTFVAAVAVGGYLFCLRKKAPFSPGKINSPNIFVDYLLVLSCLCFIIFIGYWQYQYHVFGEKYGLVTFIPMVVLFFTAYFFDHLGVLCLAITNLAAWMGIVVTPARILRENDFSSDTLIYTGLGLGLLLLVAAWASKKINVKAHFYFTYMNFGMNILFISCLAALFHFDRVYGLWFLVLALITGWFYLVSQRGKSFYFLLMLTLYAYIGLSYVVSRQSLWYNDTGGLMLLFLYYIASAVGLIIFLIRMNKKFKSI